MTAADNGDGPLNKRMEKSESKYLMDITEPDTEFYGPLEKQISPLGVKGKEWLGRYYQSALRAKVGAKHFCRLLNGPFKFTEKCFAPTL